MHIDLSTRRAILLHHNVFVPYRCIMCREHVTTPGHYSLSSTNMGVGEQKFFSENESMGHLPRADRLQSRTAPARELTADELKWSLCVFKEHCERVEVPQDNTGNIAVFEAAMDSDEHMHALTNATVAQLEHIAAEVEAQENKDDDDPAATSSSSSS